MFSQKIRMQNARRRSSTTLNTKQHKGTSLQRQKANQLPRLPQSAPELPTRANPSPTKVTATTPPTEEESLTRATRSPTTFSIGWRNFRSRNCCVRFLQTVQRGRERRRKKRRVGCSVASASFVIAGVAVDVAGTTPFSGG